MRRRSGLMLIMMLAAVWISAAPVEFGVSAPPELAILEPSRRLATGESAEIPLANLESGKFYGITVYLPEFASLGESDRLHVQIEDAAGTVTQKLLHASDS